MGQRYRDQFRSSGIINEPGRGQDRVLPLQIDPITEVFSQIIDALANWMDRRPVFTALLRLSFAILSSICKQYAAEFYFETTGIQTGRVNSQ